MYDAVTLILLVIGATAGVICALPILGVNMQIFGSKSMDMMETFSPNAKWRARLALVFSLLALLGVGISVYYRMNPRIVEKEVVKTVEEPYRFQWLGDKDHPSKHVVGMHIENEDVILDDVSYVKCSFKNVTFVYQGVAPFQLFLDTVDGFNFRSDNPSVGASLQLLYGIGAIKLSPEMLKNNKFFEQITPMKSPPKSNP